MAGVLALMVAGCSKQVTSSEDAKQNAAKSRALKIGVSFQDLDNPYFAVMKQALADAKGVIILLAIYAVSFKRNR